MDAVTAGAPDAGALARNDPGRHSVPRSITYPRAEPVAASQASTQSPEQNRRWCAQVCTTSSHIRAAGTRKWAT